MRLAVFALLAISTCSTWAAQRIVMYRCTDAQGAVILQNDKPCPKGSKQEKRVVQAPPPPAATPSPALPALTPVESTTSAASPVPTSPSTPPAPSPSAPALPAGPGTTAAVERSPPPVLYRCSTYDQQRYFSETGSPEPRCVPLQTIGLDGNPDTGVGQACEMVTDTCKRVADESLCTAWQLRLRDAESAVGFGKPELAEASNAELDRLGKIVRESACGE